MKYYLKLNIDCLIEIQNEILDYFVRNPDKYVPIDADSEHVVRPSLNEFPILSNFILPRVKTKITDFAISFLPGNSKMPIHIDGSKKPMTDSTMPHTTQYVLIIPISDCNDTINYWYDNEDVTDEMETITLVDIPIPPYQFHRSSIDFGKEPEASETVCIDSPVVINATVFHTAINYGTKPRLTIRFRIQEERWYEHYNEVFECMDLL